MVLTFGNSEKAEEYNTITMGSSDVIVYVANGEINGPIFIMACSDRYHHLVASENDWAEY